MYIHLSIYLHLSLYTYIYIYIYMYRERSIYLPIVLSIYRSIHPSIYLSLRPACGGAGAARAPARGGVLVPASGRPLCLFTNSTSITNTINMLYILYNTHMLSPSPCSRLAGRVSFSMLSKVLKMQGCGTSGLVADKGLRKWVYQAQGYERTGFD